MKCRLKSEASASFIAYGWWILEPLIHMAAFYLIFEVIMNRGTEHFVAYLLCGLIPWLWFNKTISNASASITSAQAILMQTRIPVAMFPLEVVAQDTVKQSIVFSVLLLFLTFYGFSPSLHWLALLPVALSQLLLVTACGMSVAAIVPFLPDFRFLIQTGLLMLMLGSGIFYSYDMILPEHRSLFFLNPVASLIRDYRQILLHSQWPDWTSLSLIAMISLAAILVLGRFLNRSGPVYTRILLEN